jgi:hypothetical protein
MKTSVCSRQKKTCAGGVPEVAVPLHLIGRIFEAFDVLGRLGGRVLLHTRLDKWLRGKNIPGQTDINSITKCGNAEHHDNSIRSSHREKNNNKTNNQLKNKIKQIIM